MRWLVALLALTFGTEAAGAPPVQRARPQQASKAQQQQGRPRLSAQQGPRLRAGLGSLHSVLLNGSGVPMAAPEAAVDSAALDLNRKATKSLKALAQARRGSPREPELLSRLAGLQVDGADLSFRIVHAEAYYAKKPIQLGAYRTALAESLVTLDRLIKFYPSDASIPRAYLMRARALDEAERRDEARRDYETVISKFPAFDGIPGAHLALSEFDGEDGNWSGQLAHLREALRPGSSQDVQMFILFRSAWACNHLGRYDEAFDYVRRYVVYVNGRAALPKEKSSLQGVEAMMLLRDDLLQDSTQFALSAFEAKQKGYEIEKAFALFRGLAQGPKADEALDRMAVKFTKLLRTGGYDQAALVWKQQLLALLGMRPAGLEAVLLIFEDQLNRQDYAELQKTAAEIVKLKAKVKGAYTFKPAEEAFLQASDKVRGFVAAEKADARKRSLSYVMAQLYQKFLGLLDSGDPRIPRAHFNTAEALLAAGQPDAALGHYRWILFQPDGGSKDPAFRVDPVDAGLKAISIRYDSFKVSGKVPADLRPVSTAVDKDQKLDPGIAEWIRWIDRVYALNVAKPRPADVQEKIAFFRYEATRVLYRMVQIKLAMARLKLFLKRDAGGKFGVPAAGLLLDTLIATGDWNRVHAASRQLMEYDAFAEGAFHERLFKAAAESYFKMGEALYAKQDYEGVVEADKFFSENYTKSSRRNEWIDLQARAAMALKDDSKASSQFAKLAEAAPGSKLGAKATLYLAVTRQKNLEYGPAAKAYLDYQGKGYNVPTAGDGYVQDLQERVVVLAWISGDAALLKSVLADPKICVERLKRLCEWHRVLSGQKDGKDLSAGSKAILAVQALQESSKLEAGEGLRYVQDVVAGWDELDPLIQLDLISEVVQGVPGMFARIRTSLRGMAPMSADEKAITARVSWIKRAEAAAGRVVKLPYARVRASVLHEVAGMYVDAASELRTVPPPSELGPEEANGFRAALEEVATPLQNTALEIQKNALKTATKLVVEQEVLLPISQAYRQLSVKPGEVVESSSRGSRGRQVDLELMEGVDPEGEWGSVKRRPEEPTENLKYYWVGAVKAGRIAEAGLLIQLARQRKMLKDPVLDSMQAVTLARAGAQAEALGELEAVGKKVSGDQKEYVKTFLFQFNLEALSDSGMDSLLGGPGA